MKPNPRNEQNARFVEGYEQEMMRLTTELKAWQDVLASLPKEEDGADAVQGQSQQEKATMNADDADKSEQWQCRDNDVQDWMAATTDMELQVQQIQSHLNVMDQYAHRVSSEVDDKFAKLIEACWPAEKSEDDKTRSLLRELATAMAAPSVNPEL